MAIVDGKEITEIALNGELFTKKYIGEKRTYSQNFSAWNTPKLGYWSDQPAPVTLLAGTYIVDAIFYLNGKPYSLHLATEDGTYMSKSWVSIDGKR